MTIFYELSYIWKLSTTFAVAVPGMKNIPRWLGSMRQVYEMAVLVFLKVRYFANCIGDIFLQEKPL